MFAPLATLLTIFSLMALLAISLVAVYKYVEEDQRMEKVPVRIKDQHHR
ncbi:MULTISPECIES: hypothetical protein [Enterococcus]|nr:MULTISPECIES: hypothetical protein [Enterococcus]